MKSILLSVLLFGILWPTQALVAQEDSPSKVYQLSGVVYDRAGRIPIPYARVSINKTRRGGFANNSGFFSVPVERGDTIWFNHLGFAQRYLAVNSIIPEGADELYHYEIVEMKSTDISTEPVEVYPYKTAYEAKMAIRNMPMPNDLAVEISADNLDPTLMTLYAGGLSTDADEEMNAVQRMYYDAYFKQGLQPQMVDFTEAFRLFNYLRDRSEKKKEKIYNSWPDE
ncbi:MAG: hypothetical protein ACOCZ8_03370 [Bacteroidota bacterium]